jgi:hypothetical protein
VTTYVPFRRSNVTAPRLTVVLDYQDTTMVVSWNVAAQRYYINLYTLDGVWICTVPLVETSQGQRVLAMIYNPYQGVLIARMESPMRRPPGQIVNYTLEGFSPPSINGPQECLTLADQRFSFQSDDPGVITVMGHASRYHNMAQGYFQYSTLIYRNGQFETNP